MGFKRFINTEKFKFTRYTLLLLLIFFGTLSLRLYLSFQTPDFSNEAYFNLREIEHIKQTGTPFLFDPLSYGGRDINFMPLFHYIVAFFSLFMPLWIAAKVIPCMMACTFVFIMYFIAKQITKNRDSALFAAFVSAFIPIYFYNTLNNVSEFSLVIPVLFLTFYFFLRINEDSKYIIYYVISLFILALTHQTVVILVLGLLVYLLFVRLENLERSKVELEVILFSIFLVVWLNFIIFKQALLAHGPSVIWQNIPPEILADYFKNVNILEAVYKIGIIPFALGIYMIYKTLFQEKKRHIYILMGFSITVAFLIMFKLIQLEIGLIYLGAILTLIFSQYYSLLFNLIDKSTFARLRWLFLVFLVIIFLITSAYPSFNYGVEEIKKAPSKSEMNALKWLSANSQPQDTILTTVQEGNLLSYTARRKNVMDSNFILVSDARQRYLDVTLMYSSLYSVEALQRLNKYDVRYIYFSKNAKNEYDINDIKYIEKDCFTLVYSEEDVKIYKPICRTVEGI